ncbi:MAG TPA: metal ABC transporter permease [Bacillota bacterium]|nr:metal ABC transporter permease [Bacillota bacterium]
MPDIFAYSFMIRALIAGVAIGIIAPLIGTFVVAKRYALIADSLAHVSLAGVAAGILLGINPLIGALAVSVGAAFVIERLRADRRITGEVALAMFLSGGLAIAIVLVGLANKVNVDLLSFLFGSITTVTSGDLWLIGGLSVVVLATVGFLYKQLAYTSFNEEQAQASGLPVALLNQVLIMLAAVTVVVSLRIVGGLLIGALTVIPVAAASQLARSLKQTLLYAVAIGLLAVTLGLFASFYLNLAAGGAIVLTALVLFVCALLVRRT